MKVSVNKTVRALLSENNAALREFHLRRLFSWAFLDQDKPGNRVIDDNARHPIHAKEAGLAFLRKKAAPDVRKFLKRGNLTDEFKWLQLYLENSNSGLKTAWRTPEKHIARVIQKTSDTYAVMCIVDVLVRIKFCHPQHQLSMARVLYFLSNSKTYSLKSSSERSLENYYQAYARSAAVIYGFHKSWNWLREAKDTDESRRRIDAELNVMAYDRSNLRQFLGLVRQGADALLADKTFEIPVLTISEPSPAVLSFLEADIELLQDAVQSKAG